MLYFLSVRGIGAAGSVPHWQCGGHGFESRILHMAETAQSQLYKALGYFYMECQVSASHVHECISVRDPVLAAFNFFSAYLHCNLTCLLKLSAKDIAKRQSKTTVLQTEAICR